jgi:hypothetical protein
MAIFLLVLAAAAYFGQRWRVDTYRAQRQALRVAGRSCVTTDRRAS